MSLGMFIIGAIIFSVYLYLMIWSIYYNARKQQEENYPNLTGMGQKRMEPFGYRKKYQKIKKRKVER